MNKHLIFLTGVTATGKTTFAEKASKYFEIPFISVDHVYNIIGTNLKYKNPAELVMPKKWKEFPNFSTLKRLAYKRLLNKFLPKDSDVIFEGFSLFFREDRNILRSLIKPERITIFKLLPSFKTWEDYRRKKYNSDSRYCDYMSLNSLFEKPQSYYVIEDYNKILVKYIEYQRKGFTDKKWELMKLKKEEIKGRSVIDLGCNSGWIASEFKKAGAKEVLGIDRNWRYLEDAKELGIDIKLMDLEDIKDIKKKYDITNCLATLHYIWNKQKFIKEIADMTNEMFILEVPVFQEKGLKQELRYDKFFVPTEDLVIHWLKKYFNKVEVIGESIPPDDSFRLIFKAYK